MPKITAEIFLNSDDPAFAGHFPAHPVYPAVAQLGLVLRLLEERLGAPLRMEAVMQAKFTRLLRPGMQIALEIDILGPGLASWVMTADGKSCSSGQMRYVPKPVLGIFDTMASFDSCATQA